MDTAEFRFSEAGRAIDTVSTAIFWVVTPFRGKLGKVAMIRKCIKI
jgi:hypothetical protein